MKRNCKVCQKEFETNKSYKSHCSQGCRIKHKSKLLWINRKTKEFRCKFCKKIFLGEFIKKRQFCQKSCASKYNNWIIHGSKKNIYCRYCEKLIKNRNNKFCNRKCQKKFYEKKMNLKKVVCIYCENIFYTSRSRYVDRKFCDLFCYIKFIRKFTARKLRKSLHPWSFS